MTEEAWNTGYARCLGARLAGDLIGETDERGEPVVGDTVLLLMNAHHESIPFTLPPLKDGQVWECFLDTVDPQGKPRPCSEGQPYELQGRTMAVLRTQPKLEEARQPGATIAAAEH
jgi:glycogen operon protein